LVKHNTREKSKVQTKLAVHKCHTKLLRNAARERQGSFLTDDSSLRSIFTTILDAVIATDSKWHIVACSQAVLDLHGNTSECELVGNSVLDLVAKRDRPRIKDLLQKVSRGRSLKNVGFTFLTVKGEKRPVELSLNVVKDCSGHPGFFIFVLRNVGMREALRASVRERLYALSSCGEKLNAAKDFSEVYELTLDATKRTLGFEYASFAVVENGKLRFVSQRGYSAPHDYQLPLDGSKKGLTVKAAVTRAPVLVSDVAKDKDYHRGRPHMPPTRSELVVPLVADGDTLGVLNVESEELDAFDDQDMMLLQILASHAATAISNLKRQQEIKKRIDQQASLMKSSAEMIHSIDLRDRLQAILDSVRDLGWGRVVLSLRDENLDIARPEDIVASGLTEEERMYLWVNRKPGCVWKERFGPQFERFKIGEFYYLPWSDNFVRKKFSTGTVPSHLKQEEMFDWNPDDLLYAPLRLADKRIVAVMSIDDPIDRKRPAKESLTPFELFLHQAAVAIENAQLIEQLNRARAQIQEYAEQLEAKVKERTRELMDAQKRLLKTERLAAIGELAGMVGHDLRNPLTSIAGATYYLKTRLNEKRDNRAKEMFATVENAITYSNKIIDDLLEYSKEIQLELSETEPKTLLTEALSFVIVPEGIQILDKTMRKPKIRADEGRVERVFVNIIKNAFDAMPDGGILTVRSRRIGDNVTFSFSDTGTGMSDEIKGKLWSPLFTTKAKGMGFGLPICRRIIEAHGGRISVESAVGEGSMFTVTLPIEPKMREEESLWVNLPKHLMTKNRK